MDSLISRRAAIEATKIPNGEYDPYDRHGIIVARVEIKTKIMDIPSVPAVPLDKLCEWMSVHCGRPNDCNDRLCGECNLDGEGFEYETCWKTLLTEWMEEQQNE